MPDDPLYNQYKTQNDMDRRPNLKNRPISNNRKLKPDRQNSGSSLREMGRPQSSNSQDMTGKKGNENKKRMIKRQSINKDLEEELKENGSKDSLLELQRVAKEAHVDIYQDNRMKMPMSKNKSNKK